LVRLFLSGEMSGNRMLQIIAPSCSKRTKGSPWNTTVQIVINTVKNYEVY
jgi:hypothetical protein